MGSNRGRNFDPYEEMEELRRKGKAFMSPKKVVTLVVFVVLVLVLAFCANNLFETVEKGTFHIIQRPVSGTIEAKMVPGMYWQMFADVQAWPKSDTFYFTADILEGKAIDQSIEVQFNDGSLAKISGTCRVMLPSSPEEAKALMTIFNYRNYPDMEHRLILPTIRNVLRLTANLMTARQSYAENRTDFINWSWDQIQNGMYKTEEREVLTEDPATGQMTTRTIKVIKKDAEGNPVREHNPLQGTGISLANFEVKDFQYEVKVKQQIATQQENFMAIATAKAQAERADQEAKTREAEGKAKLMEVRYQQLQDKERAVIEAQKDKEVAELGAAKKLEVAKLDAQAAGQEKTANILRGEGEAEYKKLVMAADGALKQKLEAWVSAQEVWAKAYANRNVPSVFMAGGDKDGGSNPDNQFTTFMNMLNAKTAKDLALDMTVKGAN